MRKFNPLPEQTYDKEGGPFLIKQQDSKQIRWFSYLWDYSSICPLFGLIDLHPERNGSNWNLDQSLLMHVRDSMEALRFDLNKKKLYSHFGEFMKTMHKGGYKFSDSVQYRWHLVTFSYISLEEIQKKILDQFSEVESCKFTAPSSKTWQIWPLQEVSNLTRKYMMKKSVILCVFFKENEIHPILIHVIIKECCGQGFDTSIMWTMLHEIQPKKGPKFPFWISWDCKWILTWLV